MTKDWRRLRRALQEGRLRLYCQPILDLRNGQVSRYELLLRLRENGVTLTGASFLWAAEELGLIQEIDFWVVGGAVALLRQLDGPSCATDAHLELHVNLSGRTLSDRSWWGPIERELRAAGELARRLVFEVTETAAIEDVDDVRRFMEGLCALGCRFALDDFGVGYSGFYRLRSLPFHFLKVDGAFVRHLPRSSTDQLLVRSIAMAGRILGLGTIAEQVEDEATVQLLQRFDVDYAQGFYVGRPRPVEEEWPCVSPLSRPDNAR